MRHLLCCLERHLKLFRRMIGAGMLDAATYAEVEGGRGATEGMS
jgi:hypothetical protein